MGKTPDLPRDQTLSVVDVFWSSRTLFSYIASLSVLLQVGVSDYNLKIEDESHTVPASIRGTILYYGTALGACKCMESVILMIIRLQIFATCDSKLRRVSPKHH